MTVAGNSKEASNSRTNSIYGNIDEPEDPFPE